MSPTVYEHTWISRSFPSPPIIRATVHHTFSYNDRFISTTLSADTIQEASLTVQLNSVLLLVCLASYPVVWFKEGSKVPIQQQRQSGPPFDHASLSIPKNESNDSDFTIQPIEKFSSVLELGIRAFDPGSYSCRADTPEQYEGLKSVIHLDIDNSTASTKNSLEPIVLQAVFKKLQVPKSSNFSYSIVYFIPPAAREQIIYYVSPKELHISNGMPLNSSKRTDSISVWKSIFSINQVSENDQGTYHFVIESALRKGRCISHSFELLVDLPQKSEPIRRVIFDEFRAYLQVGILQEISFMLANPVDRSTATVEIFRQQEQTCEYEKVKAIHVQSQCGIIGMSKIMDNEHSTYLMGINIVLNVTNSCMISIAVLVSTNDLRYQNVTSKLSIVAIEEAFLDSTDRPVLQVSPNTTESGVATMADGNLTIRCMVPKCEWHTIGWCRFQARKKCVWLNWIMRQNTTERYIGNFPTDHSINLSYLHMNPYTDAYDMIFMNLTANQSGIYSCVVDRPWPSVHNSDPPIANFSLELVEPQAPVFDVSSEVTVLQRVLIFPKIQFVHLNCTVSATPAARISWWRIEEEKATNLMNDSDVLTIRNYGVYICTAENRYGNATRNFTLQPNVALTITFIFLAMIIIVTIWFGLYILWHRHVRRNNQLTLAEQLEVRCTSFYVMIIIPITLFTIYTITMIYSSSFIAILTITINITITITFLVYLIILAVWFGRRFIWRGHYARWTTPCDSDTLITLGNIGEGSFVRVFTRSYPSHWLVTGEMQKGSQIFAAIKNPSGSILHQSSAIWNEIKILFRIIPHPNVLSLLGAGGGFLELVEYCELGSLRNYLADHRESSDIADIVAYAYQVANGAEYLADNNIVHRDLALHSLLLEKHNIVKICDLETSRRINSQSEMQLVPLRWKALASLSGQEYSCIPNMWLFGVVLWEMFSGQTIHEFFDEGISDNGSTVADPIDPLWSTYSLPKPKRASVEMCDLITDCWGKRGPTLNKCKRRIADHLKTTSPATYGQLMLALANGWRRMSLIRGTISPGEHQRNESPARASATAVTEIYSMHHAIFPLVDEDDIEDSEQECPHAGTFEIDRNSFSIVELISRGQFSEVFLADLLLTGGKEQAIALKQPKGLASKYGKRCLKASYSQAINELKILTHLPLHENVLSIMGACLISTNEKYQLCLVLPFCENSSLKDYLFRNFCLDGFQERVSELTNYAYQVSNGMKHLSSLNIIHRDVAMRNMLLNNNKIVKVSDFGMSVQLKQGKCSIRIPGAEVLPIWWMAIESLRDREYSQKSDVWSFGVALWELFSFRSPVIEDIRSKLLANEQNVQELTNWLENGGRLTQPQKMPIKIHQLMQECWEKDPDNRPTFRECRDRLEELLERMDIKTYTEVLNGLNQESNLLPTVSKPSTKFMQKLEKLEQYIDHLEPSDEEGATATATLDAAEKSPRNDENVDRKQSTSSMALETKSKPKPKERRNDVGGSMQFFRPPKLSRNNPINPSSNISPKKLPFKNPDKSDLDTMGSLDSGSLPPYVNLDDLKQHPWYVGKMERPKAETFLKGFPTGAFLIRFSTTQEKYVISVSYGIEVRHVKVERTKSDTYYLDTGRFFPSLVELVAFYQCNSMKESFTTLDTTLKFPVTTLIVGYAVALHNFQATAPNMISLRRDDFVIIVKKKDSERGWWKGKVDDQIGYFPLACVKEVEAPSTHASS